MYEIWLAYMPDEDSEDGFKVVDVITVRDGGEDDE